jgi:hypothetical protein
MDCAHLFASLRLKPGSTEHALMAALTIRELDGVREAAAAAAGGGIAGEGEEEVEA